MQLFIRNTKGTLGPLGVKREVKLSLKIKFYKLIFLDLILHMGAAQVKMTYSGHFGKNKNFCGADYPSKVQW